MIYRSIYTLFFAFLLGCSLNSIFAKEKINDKFQTGTVIANMLHVRAKPGEKYEVVTRLVFGDKITIKVERDDWLGIIAPIDTEAWVAANRILDGQVIEDNVPVYAGAGTIFSSFHTLNQGDKSTVLRTTGNPGWAKIQPNSDFIVWVHRNYVRFSLPTPSEIAEESTDDEKKGINFVAGEEISWKEEKKDRVSDEQDEHLIHAIMPKPVERDIILIGEKEEIQRSGTVVSLDETNYPFKYALAKKVNSTYYPLAYLSPDNHEFNEWVGKIVMLSGIQSWIRGWPRPMIQVQTIKPMDKEKGETNK